MFLFNKYLFIVFTFPTDEGQPSKPPKVAEEFEKPKTALKGEKFILECIVYGK